MHGTDGYKHNAIAPGDKQLRTAFLFCYKLLTTDDRLPRIINGYIDTAIGPYTDAYLVYQSTVRVQTLTCCHQRVRIHFGYTPLNQQHNILLSIDKMGCLIHLPARDDIVTDQQLSRPLVTAAAEKTPTSPRLFDVFGNVKCTVIQDCTDKEAAETKTSYVFSLAQYG